MSTPGASPRSVSTEPVEVLLYSDDSALRAEVRRAIGTRAAADLPPVAWTETATGAAAVGAVATGRFSALVLDAETAKVGGLAVARQVKTEVYDCPPVLALIARPQDAWLAAWSDSDAVVTAPFDPFELRTALAGLLRARIGGSL